MSNQDPPQRVTPNAGDAAPRTRLAPAPELGASDVAKQTGVLARGTPSPNEMLRASYAAAVRGRAQGAGLPPVVLSPADPHGNWPRLAPLPKYGEHRLDDPSGKPHEVVDTVPGELAFLDLIGQPAHPLPVADGPLRQVTRPDDKTDTIVRIARFLFRAAILPETGDDKKIAEAFKAIYGCTPSRRQQNIVADHVQGWIEIFWKKELTVDERLSEDDAQSIERIRGIMAEKQGHAPGPPESWAPDLALTIKGLMQVLKDHAAASVLDDILIIKGSVRTLSEKWGIALDPRPPGWTFCQAAAVYQILVILGDFGANVKEIEPQKVFDALSSYDVKAVLKLRTKFRKEYLEARATGDPKAWAAVAEKAQAYRQRVQRRRGPGKPNPDQVVAKILKLAGFSDSEEAVRRERGRERARRAGASEQGKGGRRKKARSTSRQKQRG